MTATGPQEAIDRLVDGELDDADESDLLRRLEGESDGWRRLALAFVEARRWGREFRAAAESVPASDPPHAAVQVVTPRRGRGRVLWPAVALSLLAFGAGWLAGGVRADAERPRKDPVARREPAAPAGLSPSGVEETAPTPADDRETVIVTVGDPNSDGVRKVEVPVFDVGEVAATWLQREPSAFSDALLEALRRSGHEVIQRRTYYPVGRDGGERLLVPVDEVQVQYAARPVH